MAGNLISDVSGRDWYDILNLVQSLVMAIAAVLVWVWGRDRKKTEEILDARFKAIEVRIDANKAIMEKAGASASDLATVVQTLIGKVHVLPEDLRGKFLSLDRSEDFMADIRRQVDALWNEVREIRERPVKTRKGDLSD